MNDTSNLRAENNHRALTKNEIAICRVLGAKYVSKEGDWPFTVMLWDERPNIWEHGGVKSYEGIPIADIDPHKFPSMKPGDLIELEDFL